MNSKELGRYITQLRLSCGYSQQNIADTLGIVRQAYSHYETGRNVPAYHTIVKLAELYNVSTENFIQRMNLSGEQWDELKACHKIIAEHDKWIEENFSFSAVSFSI